MQALRTIGITPDAIVCRSDRPIHDGIKRKIANMCDVDIEAVVSAVDAPSIYDIPKVLHSEGLDAYVVRRLGLPFRDVDWRDWDQLLQRVHTPAKEVTIALVGKYIDLPDAYLSVTEALRAGGFANDAKVHIRWVPSDDCETPEGAAKALQGVDGVLIPGGFGVRGIEGKLGAITFARTNLIPTLGLCLGLQCMVIEAARSLAGIEKASSAEFDPGSPDPVIATMADQEDVVSGERDMGGTMRLGLWPTKLLAGSVAARVYGDDPATERHRHRYEVNNSYRPALEAAGLVFSGTSPDGNLVEIVELPDDVAPVLHRHAGAPGVPVPPDAGAPAVRRADRRVGRPRRRADAPALAASSCGTRERGLRGRGDLDVFLAWVGLEEAVAGAGGDTEPVLLVAEVVQPVRPVQPPVQLVLGLRSRCGSGSGSTRRSGSGWSPPAHR